jgi:hypothetical protein
VAAFAATPGIREGIKMAEKAFAGDETKRLVWFHGGGAVAVAVIALAVSIYLQLEHVLPGVHWVSRAGSVVTLSGAYVAYRYADKVGAFFDHICG